MATADRLEALPEMTAPAAEAAVRGLASDRGLKAGAVIHPARVALTGSRASLGIFDVMEILGRERAVARLRDAASRL